MGIIDKCYFVRIKDNAIGENVTVTAAIVKNRGCNFFPFSKALDESRAVQILG